jgi:hypothetical protein
VLAQSIDVARHRHPAVDESSFDTASDDSSLPS